jgi:hypothetical protein
VPGAFDSIQLYEHETSAGWGVEPFARTLEIGRTWDGLPARPEERVHVRLELDATERNRTGRVAEYDDTERPTLEIFKVLGVVSRTQAVLAARALYLQEVRTDLLQEKGDKYIYNNLISRTRQLLAKVHHTICLHGCNRQQLQAASSNAYLANVLVQLHTLVWARANLSGIVG